MAMPERAARLAAFKAIMAEPISGVGLSAAIWSVLFGLVHLVPAFKPRTFGYKVSKHVCVDHQITDRPMGRPSVRPDQHNHNPQKRQTRVVAILHAFTTMYLAVKLSFMARPLEIGGNNTPGQTTVVNVAGGFFLYDIISWVIYGYLIDKCVVVCLSTYLAVSMDTGRARCPRSTQH